MKKKVLLINEGGSANLGDLSIRHALEWLLEQAGCSVRWTSFSGRKERTGKPPRRDKRASARSWKNLVKKVIPAELRWLLRTWIVFLGHLKANDCDLILIGGGQLIQSNGVFGLAMFIWVSLFKKLHKKKVVLMGVGAADKYTSFDTYLYRKSLKLADRVYVRDKDSQRVLKDNFGAASDLIPDVAFCMNQIYRQPPHKAKRALFCPTSHDFYRRKRADPDVGPDEGEYLRYWEELMLARLRAGYQVKLFCTDSNTDLGTTERLKQMLHDDHGVDVEILDIGTLEQLTEEIAQSQIVVSARMHALIIGFCYGCEVLPYETSEKMKAFQQEYIDSDVRLEEVQKRILSTVNDVVASL